MTVSRWKAAGMPTHPDGWDIAAIRKWSWARDGRRNGRGKPLSPSAEHLEPPGRKRADAIRHGLVNGPEADAPTDDDPLDRDGLLDHSDRYRALRADQVQLDLDLRRGELIEIEEVRRGEQARVREIKTSLFSMIPMLAIQLADEHDKREVSKILTAAFRDLCERFARRSRISTDGVFKAPREDRTG